MEQTPSAAAQVLISIAPTVGIVVGGTVIFFYLFWRHGERMRLVEQGIAPPSNFDLDTFALLAGLLTAIVGAVLTILFILLDGLSYILLGGMIPLAVGAGLLLFYGIRKNQPRY